MSNAFYNASGAPTTGSPGASAVVRSEFVAISNAFNLMPAFAPIGSAVIVNAGGNGLTNTAGALALAGNFTTSGAFNTTLVQQASVTLTLPAANDNLVGRATPDTLINKTLTAPVLNGTITGTYTLGGSPTIANVAISGATITTSTFNGNAFTTGSGTLTLGAGKTLTASNTLTLTGTDGSSVAFGTGGTVLYANQSITLSGDVTGSGSTAITTTVAKIAGVSVGTPTGTGNVVMSGSPTLSGTIGGALTFSGAIVHSAATTLSAALTYGGVTLTNAVTGIGKMVLDTSPTLVTPALGAATATTLAIGGASLSGNALAITGSIAASTSVSDGIGNLRTIPLNTQTAGYTLVATDSGKCIFMNTTGNVTMPSAVFTAGQSVVIINLTLANITLIQGSGLTMSWGGFGTTGNRTLANSGIVTVFFYAATGCIVSGAGLT